MRGQSCQAMNECARSLQGQGPPRRPRPINIRHMRNWKHDSAAARKGGPPHRGLKQREAVGSNGFRMHHLPLFTIAALHVVNRSMGIRSHWRHSYGVGRANASPYHQLPTALVSELVFVCWWTMMACTLSCATSFSFFLEYRNSFTIKLPG